MPRFQHPPKDLFSIMKIFLINLALSTTHWVFLTHFFCGDGMNRLCIGSQGTYSLSQIIIHSVTLHKSLNIPRRFFSYTSKIFDSRCGYKIPVWGLEPSLRSYFLVITIPPSQIPYKNLVNFSFTTFSVVMPFFLSPNLRFYKYQSIILRILSVGPQLR